MRIHLTHEFVFHVIDCIHLKYVLTAVKNSTHTLHFKFLGIQLAKFAIKEKIGTGVNNKKETS